MAKSFVPRSFDTLHRWSAKSLLFRDVAEIIQLYHKPAIIHNKHFSLPALSEKERHVDDRPQTVSTDYSMNTQVIGYKDLIIPWSDVL